MLLEPRAVPLTVLHAFRHETSALAKHLAILCGETIALHERQGRLGLGVVLEGRTLAKFTDVPAFRPLLGGRRHVGVKRNVPRAKKVPYSRLLLPSIVGQGAVCFDALNEVLRLVGDGLQTGPSATVRAVDEDAPVF